MGGAFVDCCPGCRGGKRELDACHGQRDGWKDPVTERELPDESELDADIQYRFNKESSINKLNTFFCRSGSAQFHRGVIWIRGISGVPQVIPWLPVNISRLIYAK